MASAAFSSEVGSGVMNVGNRFLSPFFAGGNARGLSILSDALHSPNGNLDPLNTSQVEFLTGYMDMDICVFTHTPSTTFFFSH